MSRTRTQPASLIFLKRRISQLGTTVSNLPVSPSAISVIVAEYLSQHPVSAVWSAISDKPEVFPPATHVHLENEPANANIQTHVGSVHAPSNAQKNSDITKGEIEAKLTGVISSHSHAGGGGDGEMSVVLGSDQSTASASFVDVPGLTFDALPNSTYIIEAFLVFQSNNISYGIGYSINGPASPSFCVGHVDAMLAASTRYVNNITGYNLVNGTSASVVAINTNYPAYVWVLLRTGANGGPVTIRHRSENASGTVKTMAGSTMRYRKVS